jgi:hypothetical protein
MASRKARLPLDNGSVDSRLCTVAERGEGLVAEVPETVLGSAGCKRSDENAEEGGESAGSGLTAEPGMFRKRIRRRRTSEYERFEASDWPVESIFGRQGLGWSQRSRSVVLLCEGGCPAGGCRRMEQKKKGPDAMSC